MLVLETNVGILTFPEILIIYGIYSLTMLLTVSSAIHTAAVAIYFASPVVKETVKKLVNFTDIIYG